MWPHLSRHINITFFTDIHGPNGMGFRKGKASQFYFVQSSIDESQIALLSALSRDFHSKSWRSFSVMINPAHSLRGRT
jgi:hypothetical protein